MLSVPSAPIHIQVIECEVVHLSLNLNVLPASIAILHLTAITNDFIHSRQILS